MTSNRRGFSRERHTELKLLIAALATCGFGLAWSGFARAHEPVVESIQAAPVGGETPVPTVTPSPTRTPAPATPPPAQPSAASTVAGSAPKPAAAPTTKKKSRGS